AARDAGMLLHELDKYQVTVMETVPSMLSMMVQQEGQFAGMPLSLNRLRVVLCQAEPLPVDLCMQWWKYYPSVPLLNGYGATECSDDVSHHHFKSKEAGQLKDYVCAPLGRLLLNTQLYILDEEMEPVPVGVGGEIYIGGKGVSRGYVKQPGLTAEKYVPNPYSSEGGGRLYRTGDVGRYRKGGEIEYLGRADQQVKV